jgi:hypothetical protein
MKTLFGKKIPQILIVWAMISYPIFAQIPPPVPVKSFGEDIIRQACGTKPRSIPKIIPKTDQARLAAVLPYTIKVYLTVFADNDGSNRASTDADQMRQFNAMVSLFAPHNICFVLLGIREVRNSDLNTQFTDEESDLNPHRIGGVFNIFTHAVVQRPDFVNLGGTAYDIPNTGAYVSLARSNLSNPNDIVTMAHEVGHALGLLHTFEPHPWDPLHGTESVTRVPGDVCWDCDVDGDYICDTPADPDQDNEDSNTGPYLAVNTNESCVYTGNRVDECNQPYVPATNNVMSYGRWSCLNNFTVGQGNRMRYFLATESDFQNILAPETLQQPTVFVPTLLYTSGGSWQVARDQVTLGGPGTSYQVIQSAYQQIKSKRIVLKSGVRLAPNTFGAVHIATNPYCQ